MKIILGSPIRFLALEWREDWNFDHPTVLLKPCLKYAPDGRSLDDMIEDAAIDVSVADGKIPETHPYNLEEFAWRGWTLTRLNEVAEACLKGTPVKFGTGYVAAKEQWVVFKPDADGFDYVAKPTIEEAYYRLCAHLKRNGYPGWLSSVGIGADKIHVMLRTERHPKLPTEWEGYPVEVNFFGEFAPLGGPV